MIRIAFRRDGTSSSVEHVSQTQGASKAFLFFTAVVVIQGVHLFEHVVQLIQVFLLNIPDDQALGLLGYVFQFQGTEEWLHLVFNVAFLLSLYALTPYMIAETPRRIPRDALWVFLVAAVGLETWHMVEHGVIISNVIANHGCPCPGIADAATGLSDTVIHFFYNTIAFTGIAVPFWYAARSKRTPKSPQANTPEPDGLTMPSTT